MIPIEARTHAGTHTKTNTHTYLCVSASCLVSYLVHVAPPPVQVVLCNFVT